MGTPLFSYKVSQSIHSMLNSSVTGFRFESKLRKSSDDLFLVAMKENWRPSQNLCRSITETLREDPSIRAMQSPQQQAVWKLLSKISRTAPDPILQDHKQPN